MSPGGRGALPPPLRLWLAVRGWLAGLGRGDSP